MAKANIVTKTQFSVVGLYTRLFDVTARFRIHQNISTCFWILLLVGLYFHFYNISPYNVFFFTSSVSCMTNEIIESVIMNNVTYRNRN